MLVFEPTLNYHVIYTDLHGPSDEGLKELVHQPLVEGLSIFQPEGHYTL